MTFALTMMETFYPNQYANKIISPIPENCKSYDLAVYWRARECEYTSLEAFARVLAALADKPRVMIVRGARNATPAFRDSVARRYAEPRAADNYFEPAARGWIVFDFDGTPVPVGLDAGDQVEGAGLYLRTLLPPEFRDARAVASVTSSTGRAPGCARLRLFFLLENRISDEDLGLWMKGVEWTWKLNLDPSILGTIQPVYTARPTFIDGLTDPVPKDRRVALLPGARDRVDIDLDTYADVADAQLSKERGARKKRNEADWRGIIDNELGGVNTWHSVIWSALGKGLWAGENEDVMIGYVVAAVAARGDRARALRYDAAYARSCIKSFKRREKRRAEEEAAIWRIPSKEEIEEIIRFVETQG